MTDLKTRFGARFQIDRDYMGAIGEDVQFRMWPTAIDEEDVYELLSPDEADALADALKHHAAEVREVNKAAGLG